MTMELQDARMSVIRVDQVFAASADERHSETTGSRGIK